MKKLLKKIDKKTDWIFPLYFYTVHAFGILMISVFIATILGEYIIPSLEKYEIIIILVAYILLVLLSHKLLVLLSHKLDTKLIRKWLTITSIGLGALYFLIRILV